MSDTIKSDVGKSDVELAYDAMPYTAASCRESHPAFLESVGRLFGFDPAPAEKCRLLEIGCGTGANLLAMAETLPDSHFVGFDLSGVQIEMGRQIAAAAGLTNVQLEHIDARNTPGELGLFDYVICHGVYSWVPEEVRSSLMQSFKRHLAPGGLVFVSYNTMPGWFSRGVIRQMMTFHANGVDDPREKVRQARHLLEFLAHCAPTDEDHYRAALKREADLIRDMPDEYLYHEHLETNNFPLWFHEFIETAEHHDLQYFGDANVGAMWTGNRPDLVNQTIQNLTDDYIMREQYHDFVVNRTFRRSLLCHAEKQFERTVRPSVLRGGYLRSVVELHSEADLQEGQPLEFSPRNGARFRVTDSDTKVFLQILDESKGVPVAIDQIVDDAGSRLQAAGIGARSKEKLFDDLAYAALQLVLSGPLELSFRPISCTREVSDRPEVSPLNRILAQQQRFVVNRVHRAVELDPALQRIVVMLNGETEVAAIVAEFARRQASGEFELPEEPAGITVASFVDRKLAWLAQNAMLIG